MFLLHTRWPGNLANINIKLTTHNLRIYMYMCINKQHCLSDNVANVWTANSINVVQLSVYFWLSLNAKFNEATVDYFQQRTQYTIDLLTCT